MDAASVGLYEYLCNKIVGTEETVTYRRHFFKVHDDFENSDPIIQHFNRMVISSGSKAEGLDLPGSDCDVMIVDLASPVYERPMAAELSVRMEYLRNKKALAMDTETSQPGFALLHVHEDHEWSDDMVITNNFGTYLSSRFTITKNVRLLEKYLSTRNVASKINGPCITTMSDSMDIAITLKCETWPLIAEYWISRPRCSDWPSTQLISDICRHGVLFVPIGSKSDSQECDPLEWRISFSEPEKFLIHSWNHTQFLCYALLKLLSKEVVKRNKNVEKIICSYFLKTTMFWLSEEHNVTIWTPENLLRCFLLCLKRLIYWNNCNYLPSYFIPQHNMIDRKIPGQSRPELVSLLENLYSEGWMCLLRCDSLKGFFNLNTLSLSTSNDCFKVVPHPFPFILYNDKYLYYKFIKCIVRIHKGGISVKSRSLYLLFLALLSSMITKVTFYSSEQYQNKENKENYLLQRKWMSYALIGTYTDSVSGWLLLALFFYTNKQYFKSLMILDCVQVTCLLVNQSICRQSSVNYKELNRTAKSFGKAKFCSYVKLRAMRTFELYTKPSDKYRIDEYVTLGPETYRHCCPPVVFFHYLNFICHHRLGDIKRRQESLHHLLWTVENDYFIEDLSLKVLSCLYLSRAFCISNDIQSAKCWISAAKGIFRSHTSLLFTYGEGRYYHRGK